MRPKRDELIEGERWYVDGRAGTINSAPYPSGYFTFHYDGAGFATNMNVESVGIGWERCEESAVDLQTARARRAAAKLGITI